MKLVITIIIIMLAQFQLCICTNLAKEPNDTYEDNLKLLNFAKNLQAQKPSFKRTELARKKLSELNGTPGLNLTTSGAQNALKWEAQKILSKIVQPSEEGNPNSIKKRISLKEGESEKHQSPNAQSLSPTSEPTFAKEPSTPDKEPTPDKKSTEPEAGDVEVDSNPFPYWIFIIGVVVVAGLIIIIRRK